MFRLGTDEALAQGRREAVLLRRSTRDFTDEPVDVDVVRRAVGVAAGCWGRPAAQRRPGPPSR